MARSRIGYNVHNKRTYGRDWSAEEKTHFIAHVERLQPTTLLFINDIDMARDIKRRLPDCAVVYRQHRHDDAALHRTMTPQQAYDFFAPYAAGEMILNILNEPSGYVAEGTSRWLFDLADWCADVMRLFDRAGIPLVLPNWGVGHPDEKRVDDLKTLWQAFAEIPLHYYGIHEYWSWRGVEPGNGRVARYLWWEDYMVRNGYPLPRVLVTEWGIDSALDGTPQRGYKDSRTGLDYAAECARAIELYRPGLVVGTCIFSWGNTGQRDHAEDWATFDVSADTDFQRAVEEYALQNVVVDANPGVGDARWTAARLTPKAGSVNVRTSPTTSSVPAIGSIPVGGVQAHVIQVDQMEPGEQARARRPDGLWQLIKLPNNVVGWYATWVTNTVLAPVDPPVPEPEPEPEPEPPAGNYVTRAEHNALLEKYMELQAALVDMETRLTALVSHETRASEIKLLTEAAGLLTALADARTADAA
ncbi:MAG: hypothetical protein BroJett033_8000 [Chloroflexota bacterium]|nr:MAG: hypothetical protein BroJett033_8000 [Chloroflexota bacterium]